MKIRAGRWFVGEITSSSRPCVWETLCKCLLVDRYKIGECLGKQNRFCRRNSGWKLLAHPWIIRHCSHPDVPWGDSGWEAQEIGPDNRGTHQRNDSSESWKALAFPIHLLLLFSRSVMSNSLQPHGLYVSCHDSLSFSISLNLLKLMSIELMMPSNYVSLCLPLLLLPSVFPSIEKH